MMATSLGKKEALKQLTKRRRCYKNKKNVDNASLPAGSPMYFDCLGCNGNIVVPENYIDRPTLCSECQSLDDLGWLE